MALCGTAGSEPALPGTGMGSPPWGRASWICPWLAALCAVLVAKLCWWPRGDGARAEVPLCCPGGDGTSPSQHFVF